MKSRPLIKDPRSEIPENSKKEKNNIDCSWDIVFTSFYLNYRLIHRNQKVSGARNCMSQTLFTLERYEHQDYFNP